MKESKKHHERFFSSVYSYSGASSSTVLFFGENMKTKQFYTVKDVSKMWEVNHRLIYQLIKQKILKAFRVGGTYRISNEEVVDFVRRNNVQKP